VAAQGDHHLKVFKTDTENSTVTAIKKLDGEGRIYELASMLSGSTVTQSAIENAKTLLKNKI
jgi:DNA repair protein RecN (Recombination protein N)